MTVVPHIHYASGIALIGAILMGPSTPHVVAQPEQLIQIEQGSDLITDYTPGDWLPGDHIACLGQDWPRYGTFDDVRLLDQIPIYGYPLKYSTFVGVNDTIQVQIDWINYTDSEYPLATQHPETWFVPRVFRTFDYSTSGVPWSDSADVEYRVRGWILSADGGLQSTPNKIPKRMDGGWFMLMDVWNLPQGNFSLCIDTTKDVPDDFTGRTGGDNYQYRTAQDLADTINAYEAIFRRALRDGNRNAAKQWVDKMLAADPASIPGWWLRATYYASIGDTAETVSSYDKAIEYLSTGADPAMPDSTKRPLLDVEKRYIQWCQQRIGWERSFYGP